ncbi:MAG: hypothetical protein U0T83_01060 [Bacteriovoracaceae bacterium]
MPVKILPPDVKALNALNSLSYSPLKLFAFTLSEVFRNYFEQRFNLPVTDRTFEEIKRELKTSVEPSVELKQSFLNVLEKTELIKFTDSEISLDDCHKLVEITKSFIEKTKREPLP